MQYNEIQYSLISEEDAEKRRRKKECIFMSELSKIISEVPRYLQNAGRQKTIHFKAAIHNGYSIIILTRQE